MSNRKKIKGLRPIHTAFDEIERIQATFTGKYNAYACDTCHKAYLTLDIDPGVTPFIMPCLATEGCAGKARSQFYPEGDPPEEMGEPVIHWVKPTPEQLRQLTAAQREHVERGGLVGQTTAATPGWARRELLEA